jgi:hypothetical protein
MPITLQDFDSLKDGLDTLGVQKGDLHVYRIDDDPRSTKAFLEKVGKDAANKNNEVSWYDAAILSQSLRRLRRQQQEKMAAILQRRMGNGGVDLNAD